MKIFIRKKVITMNRKIFYPSDEQLEKINDFIKKI